MLTLESLIQNKDMKGAKERIQKSNTLLIDCSTIDIQSIKEVEIKAKTKNLHLIDAPVSGGVVGADEGTLTFMVGGSEESFKLALPIL